MNFPKNNINVNMISQTVHWLLKASVMFDYNKAEINQFR